MNPVDNPDLFETVTIAGVTWSGTAVIAGLHYEMGWTVQEADGENGATVTRKGRVLSKFTIRLDIVRDPSLGIDQFAEWYDVWVPLLKSCFVGETPVGLTIEYPDAQALSVDSILIQRIGQLQIDAADPGHAVVDIAAIQYAPAKKVSTKKASGSKSKGKGSGGNNDPGSTYDPNDPINKRVDTLNKLLDGP